MSVLDRYSLKGKVAIITGASQGLGEAIAMSMAEAGADLVLAARNAELLEKVAGAVKAKGVKALVVKADMLKVADIQNMVDKTMAEFGKIDVLVNNAGVNIVKPFVDITEEEYDRVLDTNLKAYFLASQCVGRIMLQQKSGVVIHNASIFGRIGFPNLSPYICSKAALVGLTKAMAVEWGRKNIRVLCIAPSYIMTEMAKRDIEKVPAILEQNLKKIPMRRGGEPREVGDVVAFLASDAASFMSGETVAIDGGWLSM
jgi:NAD(P)-dependent dehydrogenase (short-subunit alcohol dehydrogenase family)